MQTERVTYLTSAEQKAALEAFARSRGESVGNVVREATARYMAKPPAAEKDEAVLEMLVDELEASLPRWSARFDSMEASIARARKSIRDAIEAVEATR